MSESSIECICHKEDLAGQLLECHICKLRSHQTCYPSHQDPSHFICPLCSFQFEFPLLKLTNVLLKPFRPPKIAPPFDVYFQVSVPSFIAKNPSQYEIYLHSSAQPKFYLYLNQQHYPITGPITLIDSQKLQGLNHFTLQYLNEESSPVSLIVIQKRDISEVTQMLEKKAIYQGMTINIACPISFDYILTPVKGVNCTHESLFDLKSFLILNNRVCPICDKQLLWNNLLEFESTKKSLEIVSKAKKDLKGVIRFDTEEEWTYIEREKGEIGKEVSTKIGKFDSVYNALILEGGKSDDLCFEEALKSTEGKEELLELFQDFDSNVHYVCSALEFFWEVAFQGDPIVKRRAQIMNFLIEDENQLVQMVKQGLFAKKNEIPEIRKWVYLLIVFALYFKKKQKNELDIHEYLGQVFRYFSSEAQRNLFRKLSECQQLKVVQILQDYIDDYKYKYILDKKYECSHFQTFLSHFLGKNLKLQFFNATIQDNQNSELIDIIKSTLK